MWATTARTPGSQDRAPEKQHTQEKHNAVFIVMRVRERLATVTIGTVRHRAPDEPGLTCVTQNRYHLVEVPGSRWEIPAKLTSVD